MVLVLLNDVLHSFRSEFEMNTQTRQETQVLSNNTY